MTITSIGIANSHPLFLKSLSHLISDIEGFEVIIEAQNGEGLLQQINTAAQPPAIIILDIPGGMEAVQQILQQHPTIKLVALSLNEDEKRITDMLRAGCCAYLPKKTSPEQLAQALKSIRDKGFYRPYPEQAAHTAWTNASAEKATPLSEKEQEFLTLACSELTYQEIARKMNLSERTIDGYREAMFAKLKVQSRVGMCVEAIRRGWIRV